MPGWKPKDTLTYANCKIGSKEDSPLIDKGRYRRIIGKLIYLSHTHPNISFFVSVVNQFMHNPTNEHMQAIYRIVRYLKITLGKGLLFKKIQFRIIQIFSYANWVGSVLDQ